jgi:hypothetical protein
MAGGYGHDLRDTVRVQTQTMAIASRLGQGWTLRPKAF